MPSGNVSEFYGNISEFNDRINTAGGFCIVEFYSSWSEPSQELLRVLPKLAREFPEVQFIKVDIEANPDVAKDNRITSLPHVNLMRRGNPLPSVVTNVIGYDVQLLRKTIEENVRPTFD